MPWLCDRARGKQPAAKSIKNIVLLGTARRQTVSHNNRKPELQPREAQSGTPLTASSFLPFLTDDWKHSIGCYYLSVWPLDPFFGSFTWGDILLHSEPLSWELQQALSAGLPRPSSAKFVNSGFDGVTLGLLSQVVHFSHLCWMLPWPSFKGSFHQPCILCIPFLLLVVDLIKPTHSKPKAQLSKIILQSLQNTVCNWSVQSREGSHYRSLNVSCFRY